MGLLDKLFGKKQEETSTKKAATPKKEKVAKRDPNELNKKEVYKIEKAKRQEAAKKRREQEALEKAKQAEADKIAREEQAKKEEAIREENLKKARLEAEAKKEASKMEKTSKKEEEPTDLYGFSIETLTQGDIIEVEILADARENYLARSTKNFQEVYLPKNELKLDDGEHFVRVGDTLEVLVYRHTNDDFYVSLRRLKNKQQMSEILNDEAKVKVIRGHVLSYKEPFFTVKLQNGMLGDVFVRNMDTAFISDPEIYVGNDYSFTIKAEREDREAMYELDRRTVLNQELKIKAASLKVGQILEISNYDFNKGGLAFDFDGIRGFVPMRELSHSYISGSEEAKNIITGTQKVEISEIQEKRGEIQILASIKALITPPFTEFSNTNNEGDILTGKISRIERYGIFVQLAEDVRGLVHNTDMSSDVAAMIKKIKIGDELTVKIKTIDIDKKQVNLTTDLNEEVAGE